MRNRRDRRRGNKLVLHVTNRTVCGLPFVCRLYMLFIIRGIMARAQELYPVQVCHFQWMSNHYHLIVAGKVKYLSNFTGYLQAEIAKSVKRLTGQYQSKVWAGRAKEQQLCTEEDVIDKIIYLYANPVKANLIAKAIDWPGLSSWRMYRDGGYTFSAKWVRSSKLRKICRKVDYCRDVMILKDLIKLADDEHEFRIFPNIWKRCFKQSRNWSDEYIFSRISEGLAAREEELAHIREAEKRCCIGARRLKRQSIHKQYRPGDKGRSPFLICWDCELRKDLIESYRYFCELCREAWKRWKRGEVSVQFPIGAYRPGLPLLGRVTWESAVSF